MHLEGMPDCLSPMKAFFGFSVSTCLIVFINATLQYVVNALTKSANKILFNQHGSHEKIITQHNVIVFYNFLTAALNLNFDVSEGACSVSFRV